ncbi:hypothetical protein CPC08DRAFT_727788 [Agrocybe pediades]|nr:hypothetical protein CPC08DRAFT_727788 [Agrocybe pediades]
MKDRVEKFFKDKLTNLKVKAPSLRSLRSRGPSRELLPMPPTERPTESQSAPPTENPHNPQLAPPAERPSDPQSALHAPTELSTNSQSVPPSEMPTNLHSTHPTEKPTDSQSKPHTQLGPTDSGPRAGVQEQAQKPSEKLGSMLWKTTQTALRLLEKNSDGFPPLKTAVGVLVTCLDITQDVIDNHKEYNEVAVELKDMATSLASHAPKLMERGDDGSIALILKSINEELAQIKKKLGRGKFKRAIEASEDKDDIINRYRKIDSLFRRLLSDITLRTHVEIVELRKATDTLNHRLLDDSSQHIGTGTRRTVQLELLNNRWASGMHRNDS